MTIEIESPHQSAGLEELLQLSGRVHQNRRAWWPEHGSILASMLGNAGPFAHRRTFRPFLARRDGEPVARVVALVDHRYVEAWGEPLGHLLLFEALPEVDDAVQLMLERACGWLARQGMEAARSGFGPLELPYVVDDYESLPPIGLKQNPAYYHRLLKDAGFETEKGAVDYKIGVDEELRNRYQAAVERAGQAGFVLRPLRDLAPEERYETFTATHNAAFRRHWGFSPFSREECELLLQGQAPLGALETSVVAYDGDGPIGVSWSLGDPTLLARTAVGSILRPDERVNYLGVGVLERARGHGLGGAMAAYAYLRYIAAGAQYLSYTLVLDDNWPSRRTAEALGASVCASYVVYRRNFRTRF